MGSCFLLLALLPHIENQSMGQAPGTRPGAATRWFARAHLCAGCGAFASFALAELIVIRNNSELSKHELWWRSLALASLMATMCAFVFNQVLCSLVRYQEVAGFASRWAFRYEVFLATSYMWANQICWHFSGPAITALALDAKSDYQVFPFPHVCAMLVILQDLYHNSAGLMETPAGIVELCILGGFGTFFWSAVTVGVILHPLTENATYGSCSA